MRILGIDTSSELSSVALVDADSVITREVLDGRRHAEVLAVLLREDLKLWQGIVKASGATID